MPLSGRSTLASLHALLRGLVVLVVDDDPDSRDAIVLLLEDLGATVESAGGGNEALTRLSQRRPDLIMSDLAMPGITGRQLLERVREDRACAGLPVIAVSASEGPEPRQVGGFDGQLGKPFTYAELCGVLQEVYSRHPALFRRQLKRLRVAAERNRVAAQAIRGRSRCISLEQRPLGRMALGPRRPRAEPLEAETLRTYPVSSPRMARHRLAPGGDHLTFAARDTLPLQGITVLIVKDHADSLDAIRLMVESLGARVFVGQDARQALATLEGTPVDVLLCNLRMPGMDGFELNARIRHDPRWHHVLVIAITSLDSPADYHSTLEAGLAGHLAKPIDVEVLCSTIQNAITRASPFGPDAAPRTTAA